VGLGDKESMGDRYASGTELGKPRRPCDNPIIKNRVAVIKPTSNECCSKGFGD